MSKLKTCKLRQKNYTQYNTLQGALQVKESSSSASIGLTSVITFAIGQSQSYGDQYNKFGDYDGS